MANNLLTTHYATDEANTAAYDACVAGHPAEGLQTLLDFLAVYKDNLSAEQLLRTKINLAMALRGLGRFEEARAVHLEVAPLAEASLDYRLRAVFHAGYAVTLQRLGDCDGAFENFTAASVFFERSAQWRLKAQTEGNIAQLLVECGHAEEAREYVARALGSCHDADVRAQIEETGAQVALALGCLEEALAFIASSCSTLLRLKRDALLKESVKTLGRILAAWERREEAERLRGVLIASGWNLTRAAAPLGFESRQALTAHLQRHFPELLDERRNKSVAFSDE